MQKAAATPPSLSFGLRFYLYLTSAMAGCAVMIIEIVGAKILAPYMGTSHFVWVAQIGVTLAALSCGYFLGGFLADRYSKNLLPIVYRLLALTAFGICLSVRITQVVAFATLDLALPLATILTSSTLFFLPLTFLAAVGPILIRIMTRNVESAGGVSGRLFAVSTAGSFLGTILIGYFLIPLLPNSMTLYLTGMTLFLLSMLFFSIWKRKLPTLAIILVLATSGFFLGKTGVEIITKPKYADGEQIFRVSTNFGLLQVIRSPQTGALYLLNDYVTMNDYDPKIRNGISMFSYTLEQLAKTYTAEIHDVLCVGLGAGLLPMHFSRQGAHVDVVEINPLMPVVAARFFECDLSRFNLTLQDGRYFINRSNKKYDVVFFDATLGESAPSHLMTLEAFEEIRNILKPRGIFIINFLGWPEEGKDVLAASMQKTLLAAFKSVKIHTANNGNVFAVASKENLQIFRRPNFEAEVAPSARELTKTALNKTITFNSHTGVLLSDDFHPAEFYDAPNREKIRKDLALYIRKQVMNASK
jgi:spermidine synthase